MKLDLKLMKRCDSLELLYPPFRERLERLITAAHAQSLMAYPFETWRSPALQESYFAKGRTQPGRIITRADAWMSNHQYGVAADLVFDGSEKPGIQWDWSGDYIGEKIGDYERLGALGMQYGLVWYGAVGSPFHEKPHFQWPSPLRPRDMLRLYKEGGIERVWLELDRYNSIALTTKESL